MKAVELQRDYYARTAMSYDHDHRPGFDEHDFALAWLSGLINPLGIKSILDVGSGTGRALQTLRRDHPNLRIVGIEPSPELRSVGYGNGVSSEMLIDGDAYAINFPDESFDIVTEFGVLHHVEKPSLAVSEMLRVARVGLLISDANNFGQGGPTSRLMKRTLRLFRLWHAFDKMRTRGKGYHTSEGDGVFYSYSVFDNLPQIGKACKSVHILNTVGGGTSAFREAAQVAVLGLKQNVIQAS